MSAALSERQTMEIEAFCEIARANGAAISLSELVGLASGQPDERRLESAFLSDSHLSSRFFLDSGYVFDKPSGPGTHPRESAALEEARRHVARGNLLTAREFGMSLASGAVVVSVSGANSYLSASDGDDIDFFCVTRADGMWAFMLRALALARIHRLAHGKGRELCFSCTMDEEWAAKTFRARQHQIFARDALSARVISGRGPYGALLEQGGWMSSLFPVLYRTRLGESDREARRADGRRGSKVVNYFLYFTLGSFLRIKSWALNRRLAKASRHSAVFATKIGLGHYIYESNRYRELRAMYPELEKDG